MPIPIPDEIRVLLDAPNYVHLSTLRADGRPRNWVVWVGREDDNVLVWHSGDREDNDRPRALRVIHWFIKRTTERRYEILDRQLFDGGFVQQHILYANCRNGGSIALRVCIVIKLGANGLISRIDEYFDPAEMALLLESADSQRR